MTVRRAGSRISGSFRANMARARVIVADDHALILEGLRGMLEPEFEVVAAVGDGRALLRAAQELRPDIIVVDISMPLLNGIEAITQIRELGLRTRVVVLTIHADAETAAQALAAGAAGYVLKSSDPAHLQQAVREVLHGRNYVSPEILANVMPLVRGKSRVASAGGPLSSRQREVLQLVAEGRTSREIADLLHISPNTVEFHKVRIKRALGLKTIAELSQYAMNIGLVSSPQEK